MFCEKSKKMGDRGRKEGGEEGVERKKREKNEKGVRIPGKF